MEPWRYYTEPTSTYIKMLKDVKNTDPPTEYGLRLLARWNRVEQMHRDLIQIAQEYKPPRQICYPIEILGYQMTLLRHKIYPVAKKDDGIPFDHVLSPQELNYPSNMPNKMSSNLRMDQVLHLFEKEFGDVESAFEWEINRYLLGYSENDQPRYDVKKEPEYRWKRYEEERQKREMDCIEGKMKKVFIRI